MSIEISIHEVNRLSAQTGPLWASLKRLFQIKPETEQSVFCYCKPPQHAKGKMT
jgi:hypothetical protein